jgi:hypothetical protein
MNMRQSDFHNENAILLIDSDVRYAILPKTRRNLIPDLTYEEVKDMHMILRNLDKQIQTKIKKYEMRVTLKEEPYYGVVMMVEVASKFE